MCILNTMTIVYCLLANQEDWHYNELLLSANLHRNPKDNFYKPQQHQPWARCCDANT